MAEQHLDLSGIKTSLLQLFDSSILNRLGESVSIRFEICMDLCSVVDRHRVDPDPNFHFEAEPDPDPDPDPTLSFTHFGKSEIF
jgi:hypothetical protein